MRKQPIRKFCPTAKRKGEGGEEATNPESEYLPAGAHRALFARRGETLIAKMKGESPDPRIPCGSFWPSPEQEPVQKFWIGRIFPVGFFCFFVFANRDTAHADTSGVSFLGFDDIQFWAGSGTNRAALLIQWNDGRTPSSLVWGYRWNDTATGFDMLTSIAGYSASRYPGSSTNHETFTGADPRLMVLWSQFSFGKALDSVVFKDGSNQRYQNDWNDGFWEYSLFGGQFSYDVYDGGWNFLETASYNQSGSVFFSGVIWLSSPIGAMDRILVDGAWDAWSFAANFNPSPLVSPQPTPLTPPVSKSIRLVSSTQLEIIFQTTPKVAYQLESNSDLQPSNWAPYGDVFTANSSETSRTIPIQIQNPRQFYRLRQLP